MTLKRRPERKRLLRKVRIKLPWNARSWFDISFKRMPRKKKKNSMPCKELRSATRAMIYNMMAGKEEKMAEIVKSLILYGSAAYDSNFNQIDLNQIDIARQVMK